MSTFHLQIVTPDGGFFDGEAEKLIVRAIDGDVCILARHSPYVTALGTGEARVTIDGKRRRAACAGGMLAVTKDNVRLVATTFEWAEDIDADRAQRAKERAEQLIEKAKDQRELELAQARLKRALTRLQVTAKQRGRRGGLRPVFLFCRSGGILFLLARLPPAAARKGAGK